MVFLSLLEQCRCLPYFGIGLNPVFPYTHCGVGEDSRLYELEGILCVPQNMIYITDEQLLTNQALIRTNLDFRGKEKHKMHIGNHQFPHIAYNSIEFLEELDRELEKRKK